MVADVAPLLAAIVATETLSFWHEVPGDRSCCGDSYFTTQMLGCVISREGSPQDISPGFTSLNIFLCLN